MVYQGVIKNGVVIFPMQVALPDGTPVEVSPVAENGSSLPFQPADAKVVLDVVNKTEGDGTTRSKTDFDFRNLPAFGMWDDLDDEVDSAELARQIRRQVSTRPIDD